MSHSRFRNVDDDVGADILESAHMVSMLLYLYDNGECEIDMAIRTSEVPDAPVGIQGC